MSTTTRIPAAVPGDVEYTVRHTGNCVLVFGSVPLDAVGALVRLVPKDALMSTRIAKYTGATLAMGLKADLDALETRLSS